MEYVHEMPAEMLEKTHACGEVKRFEYDTKTYEEGSDRSLRKGAWVYLPHGYDQGRQYDVLYLLHGGGVNEDWWFKTFPDTVAVPIFTFSADMGPGRALTGFPIRILPGFFWGAALAAPPL